MRIKVLYENSNILAIDKPAGISVHPDGRSKEKTLVDWILKNYPRMKNVGEPMGDILRPGVVHRLDRDTSGVLLLAKNNKAYEFLKSQFQNREVKKTYHALVSGYMKDERGVINRPIGRSPTDFRKYSASRGARGQMREAVTRYKVLKRIEMAADHEIFSRFTLPRVRGGSYTDKKSRGLPQVKFTYLEVYPKTGRTHQIRVHMKAIDHPVVCDPLYNPKGPCPKGFKRMALHAKSIEFKDLKGNIVKIESPLPKEFSALGGSAFGGKKVLES